ncbi:MAG TPA: MFS transporter [Hellea balneolensis]|uniref:MFS transporter n=1 Tax=Hellea balneolensis TaxID=287478 RepID=A0A7C3G5Q2_9PROT|nr:MFS transporter [Hellea balneolensis]
MRENKNYKTLVLILLTIIYGFSFIDRQIVGILAPFIQSDLQLSNTQLGLLSGVAFAAIYVLAGIPLAWLADRYNRVNILSLSLAMWSGFTALTGMAGNFTQIGLARMGVGIGEAGGSPSAHSIISDLYPKEKRASALAVYSLGIPFGIMFAYFVTASLLGKSGDAVDWRRIFIILGVVGIGFAVFIRLVLREPKRGAMEIAKDAEIEKTPFFESLFALLSIPSWWAMCLGIAFGSFVAYAFSTFQTKYIIALDPDFNFKTLLYALGLINGIAYAGGTFLGAKLADMWGKKDVRAYGWVPAITIALALPCGVASFWVPSVWLHLACVSAFLLFLGVYLGPSFAIAQTLAPINMRAMSTAMYFFILNAIALAGGPFVAGVLVDVFLRTFTEVQSLRFALTAICASFVLSIISFLYVAKHLPKDWDAAQKRNQGLAKQTD